MRNGFRILDTDSHQMEPPNIWADHIDPAFADRAPRIGDMGNGRAGMCVEGEPITKQDGSYPMHSKEFHEAAARGMEKHEKARAKGFRPEARLADMDAHGVDAQVLYPTVGGQMLGKEFDDPELLAAVCRAYNDWSLEYCSAAPERLRMAAMLPVQAPDLAIEEAKRTAAKGAAGFYVRPNPVCGRNLHHEANDPLWAVVEELGIPLCIHDSGSPYLPSFGERMETHTSGHIIAHPVRSHGRDDEPDLVRGHRALPQAAHRPRRSRRRVAPLLAATHGATLGLLRQRRASLAQEAPDRVLQVQLPGGVPG